MKKIFQNQRPGGAGKRGFTLVEMLVATFVLVIILGMTLQITNYANNLFLSTRKRIDAFQEARAGFETMTRKLSQAMLNTYWDYANGTVGSGTGSPRPAPSSSNQAGSSGFLTASGTWQPTQYLRNSQLHFISGQATSTSSGASNTIIGSSANILTVSNPVVKIVGHCCFFQAPLGYSDITSNTVMPGLLNSCGYFLEFSSDNPDRPAFLVSSAETGYTAGSDALSLKYRFRLKEFNLPSEYMYVYQYLLNPTNGGVGFNNWWFSLPLTKRNSSAGTLPFSPKYTLAQNVIALVIEPMRSPNYPVAVGSAVELAPQYYYDSREWASTTLPAATANSAWAIAARNQLPPQVMVTMVAIDEASAARLQSQYGGATGGTIPTFSDTGAANAALPGGLYGTTGISQIFLYPSITSSQIVNASDPRINSIYRSDLANLEQALVNLHITYRVFSTNVTILQAKFSD